MLESTCALCGAAFEGRNNGGKPQRYCSKAHYTEAANIRRLERRKRDYVVKPGVCEICRSPCRRYGARAFCGSDDCRRERNLLYGVAQREGQLVTPITYRNCADCGRLFVGRVRTNRLYCDRDCAQRAGKRAGKHRRRTVERVGDFITIHELGERDGWSCHLCPDPVVLRSGGLAMSPSIDHLVPISRGGEHTWANVKLAHKICNSRRWANPLPAVA